MLNFNDLMLHINYDDSERIYRVLCLANRQGLHDADESLTRFLFANQRAGQNGIAYTLFEQIMILGVLQAAANISIDDADEAAMIFEQAKDDARARERRKVHG